MKAGRRPDAERLFHSVLPAAVAVGILFAAFQVVEETWLRSLEMDLIHALHILRGLTASGLAALIVGALLLRGSPPLIEDAGPAEALHLPTEKDRILHYGRWFIRMRWIAVVVAAALIYVTVKAAGLLPEKVWWPLVFTVAALAGTNLLYILLLRTTGPSRNLLSLQVYSDLGVLGVLIHFSGGIENPLSLLPLFHVVIAGILLSRRACYMVAAVATLLFAALAWAEWAGFVEHYTLLIFPHGERGDVHAAHEFLYVVSRTVFQGVLLFMIAYFVTTLMERVRSNERGLEAMARRALSERALLEQSLATTDTGLRVLDGDLKTRWSNDRWDRWFPFDQPGPAGGSAVRDTLRDGKIRTTRVVVGAGGRAGPVLQITTAPLRSEEGIVQGVVQLAQDITERERAQDQLMRAGKLAAVGELSGHVAHEVNNPIAIINAKARLLLSGFQDRLPEKVTSDLSKIVDLSDRVARIARGLLSYCRPSAAARGSLDIRVPIRKSLSMVEERARRSGVEIAERLPEKPARVRANAGEMEQVLLNLFLNALDAMPRGGRLAVETEVRMPDASVAVIVQDTGTGIPEELHEKIFEPFFSTKKEGRGTGLGLSICAGIVRSHGGRIDVDSRPGEGARFTITLPAETEAAPKEDRNGQDAGARCGRRGRDA